MPKPQNSKHTPNANGESLEDYITRHQVDGIFYKADRLLGNLDNSILKGERSIEIAATLALVPNAVTREDYAKKIGKKYDISWPTFKKLIDDSVDIHTRKKDIVRAVRKNTVARLDGNPKTFPFFNEVIQINKKDGTRTFKGIKIDILKYLQFLMHFGFTRYSSENDDGFTFIRVIENVISEVHIEEVKDFVLDYVDTEYDYSGAGCEETDSEVLANHFLENIKKYFSKDLFARLRSKTEIIINRDTRDECFLYFQNGFARITKDGYELLPYDKMDGSVWIKQMLQRNFTHKPVEFAIDDAGNWDMDGSFTNDRPMGDFADFIWRISGQKQQRFISLCTILGYLTHDYYDYKLKAVFLTDSLISERSEGRTGKTVSMQMMGNIRSYAEVNGKQFDPNNERKYEAADRSTQILHINDVSHKGKFRFDLESVFNDITEGYIVKQMYQTPFRHRSKMVISSNKSIQVEGSSARDRIIEFEMSQFFHENRSPFQYYGRWLGGSEWTDKDWMQFDNFLCWCVQGFLANGLIPPETINLEARKLLDGTCREFVDFMEDLRESVKATGKPWPEYQGATDADLFVKEKRGFEEFEFDKKQLYNRFLQLYEDWKHNHFSQKRFTDWLRRYALYALGVKDPMERRSNNNFYIQFKERE